MCVIVRYLYIAACHHVSFSCMHKVILCGNYYGFIFLTLQGMYNYMLAIQNSLVLLTVKFHQPRHEFIFGVDMSFILYQLVLTPLV
jgi:hypothetical protein